MKIENVDRAQYLIGKRDLFLRMISHLSPENRDRRIRVQFHSKPDDTWDDVSADDKLLGYVTQAVEKRLKEIEKEILELD